MSVQPPRFAVRSLVIRDISISPGARILYMYLDDETRDHWRLYEKQLRLAVKMGITTRQLRTQLGELRDAGYLTIRQTMNGNVYDLERKKTSGPNGKETSDRSGRKLPVLPITQETTSSPQPPASGGQRCGLCEDVPHRIMVSRDGREAVRQWCPACGGNRERRAG